MPAFQRLCLPGIGQLAATYAAGPVWHGSTTKPVQFAPMAKKAAIRLYNRVAAWDRRTRRKGCQGGVIGKAGVAVIRAMLFDFINYRTGQLDPSYEGLALKTGYSRATIATALRKLRAAGVLAWVRRCVGEMRDGRYVLAQERNAYAVLPESHWRGYTAPQEAPTAPDAGTWGEHPPLPTAIAQAIEDRRMGLSAASAIAALESDPADSLAAALARLGKAVGLRQSSAQQGV